MRSKLLCGGGLIATLAAVGLAAPADTKDPKPLPQGPAPLPNFYLVTTTQQDATSTSADLANVNATSLFDPSFQTNFLLRLIGPGYNSLPQFNMTTERSEGPGFLSTLSEGIEGHGLYIYNSTLVQTGAELQFVPEAQSGGNLGLRDGYLLTVDGEAEGWTVCVGEQQEQVISWKGMDSTCERRYIQAVQKPPY